MIGSKAQEPWLNNQRFHYFSSSLSPFSIVHAVYSFKWWEWRDSNSHALRHVHLKHTCTANFTTLPLVGLKGLEPSRLSALPPQGSVCCQFHHRPLVFMKMVAGAGFEPATSGLWARLSNHADIIPQSEIERRFLSHRRKGLVATPRHLTPRLVPSMSRAEPQYFRKPHPTMD